MCLLRHLRHPCWHQNYLLLSLGMFRLQRLLRSRYSLTMVSMRARTLTLCLLAFVISMTTSVSTQGMRMLCIAMGNHTHFEFDLQRDDHHAGVFDHSHGSHSHASESQTEALGETHRHTCVEIGLPSSDLPRAEKNAGQQAAAASLILLPLPGNLDFSPRPLRIDCTHLHGAVGLSPPSVVRSTVLQV